MLPQRQIRMLIVEDDKDWCSRVSLPLEKQGYLIQFAPNNATALAVLQDQVFDLALVNILLRGEITDSWRMDWTNLLGEAQAAGTDVIVITSMNESAGEVTKADILGEALQYGVKDVFFKGDLSRRKLLARVQELVGGRTGRRRTSSAKIRCNHLALLDLLDSHLMPEEIEDIRLGLGVYYAHWAFRSAGNLKGDIKREKLKNLMELLSTFGPQAVCRLCQVVRMLKLNQKNSAYVTSFMGVCRERSLIEI